MRVYNEHVELDYGATARFFAERGRRMEQVGPLCAVLYQDQKPELAEQRSAHEIATMMPRFVAGRAPIRVLDVGCGTGRWATTLADDAASYLGLDFCEDFLAQARGATASLARPERFAFLHADLSKGLPDAVAPGSFDTVIMAGVLLYLNDADALRVLCQLGERIAAGGRLYLREPLGLQARLTLESHFSQDLGAEYSSVYRGCEEFGALLQSAARRTGLQLRHSGELYPSGLENRAETRQFCFILDKA
jgi:SAM-dependent methyltransferase